MNSNKNLKAHEGPKKPTFIEAHFWFLLSLLRSMPIEKALDSRREQKGVTTILLIEEDSNGGRKESRNSHLPIGRPLSRGAVRVSTELNNTVSSRFESAGFERKTLSPTHRPALCSADGVLKGRKC
ncbi:hypothetical protein BT93_A1019 [Corymbia citriodora subsp. variegata]|nr:hypothetical protein BT93_A1019 [Corymbia citriodora subsp. variegata]